MPARRFGGGGGDVTREGMDGWTRERDNRYRELCTKRDNADMTESEMEELRALEVDNEKFISAGLKYQRGEGISTRESIFVLLGYAIGLGNVWRFPYLLGKYGGSSFLIAYFVCLAFIAHPLYVLELGFGQTMKKSTFPAFVNINKRWGGVGYTSTYLLTVVLSHYAVLCAYCFMYFFRSFADPLPWAVDGDYKDVALGDLPGNMTPAGYYFHHDILGQDVPNDATGLGGLVPQLVMWCVLVLVLVFFAVYRGIKAEVKVTYVTVTASVVLLTLFTLRAIFLPGAWDGIKFLFFRFEVESFFNPVMWAEAGSTGLFSLVFLPGTSITLASYLQPKSDIYRISWIVMLVDTLVCIVGGMGVYAVIGHVAYESCGDNNFECQSVENISDISGTSVAFVAIADGLTRFGFGSTMFSIVFYFALITLALDTLFAGCEALITNAEDFLVYFFAGRVHLSRMALVVGIMIVLFFLSMLFTTVNGLQLMEIVTHFGTTYLLLLMSAAECFMAREVGWDIFETQVQLETTGLKHINNGRGRILPGRIKWSIKFVTPALCLGFVLSLIIKDIIDAPEDSGGEEFSSGFIALGWVITFAGMAILCLGGYCTSKPPEQLKRLFNKTPEGNDNLTGTHALSAESEIEEPLIAVKKSSTQEQSDIEAQGRAYTPPPGHAAGADTAAKPPAGQAPKKKRGKSRVDPPTAGDGEQRISPTQPSAKTLQMREEIQKQGDAIMNAAPMIDTDEEPDGTGETAARRKELEAQGQAILCEGSLVISEENRTPRGTGVTDRMREELERAGQEVIGEDILESEGSDAGNSMRKTNPEVRVSV